MKKKFELTDPRHKTPRLFEAVRSDVKKYIKRERAKELPKGVDFWDFSCKFGPTAAEAKPVHVAELGSYINAAEEQQQLTFYIEILSKPGHRTKKPDGVKKAVKHERN